MEKSEQGLQVVSDDGRIDLIILDGLSFDFEFLKSSLLFEDFGQPKIAGV